MLEIFHFDIIIIIVLLYSIVIGLFRGFYKQLLAFLALAIPMVAVYFLNDYLTKILLDIKIFETITNYIYKGGKYFLNITIEQVQTLLIFSLIFIISFIIIHGLIKLFIASKKRDAAKRKIFISRIIGVLLGLCNAYLILILILVLTTPLISNLGTGFLTNNFIKLVPKLFILRM
ncbi:MAG TPA: CvpA family protein [Bacilli bacterium]